MDVTQTWRTCRRPEFCAGFTSPLAGSVFKCENILRAKPRPITSGEEIICQLYESDNE
jgi:hypothetical protein